MVITIHQPAYLPWLGYFDKIFKSDIYVFLDTVQIEKNSYTNRNRIKNANGATWLTVPLHLKGHMSNVISEIRIDNSQSWQNRHLKSIYNSYRRSPYFDNVYPKLEILYQKKYEFFSELAYQHLIFWLDELKIDTKIKKASEILMEGKGSALLLELCLELGATRYVSGELGKNYLDERAFAEKSIQVDYQNYHHPQYPQLYGAFLPNLSIVDFWMNTQETSLIWNARK